MNAARRLVYDFLSLPFHVQMSIGRELDLIEVSETFGMNDTEMFTAWFGRAKRQGKLEQLRDLVAARVRERERWK